MGWGERNGVARTPFGSHASLGRGLGRGSTIRISSLRAHWSGSQLKTLYTPGFRGLCQRDCRKYGAQSNMVWRGTLDARGLAATATVHSCATNIPILHSLKYSYTNLCVSCRSSRLLPRFKTTRCLLSLPCRTSGGHVRCPMESLHAAECAPSGDLHDWRDLEAVVALW